MNNTEYNVTEKDILRDEKISLFLQGLMSTEEESEFILELKEDDDLREMAIARARIAKGMKQADEQLINSLGSLDAQDIIKIAGGSSRKTSARSNVIAIMKRVRWYAVAASVILIAFLGVKSYDYFNTISLGKEYANAFPAATVIRGETDMDVEVELTALFDKVSNGEDLSDATSRLYVLWEQAKQDTYNDYTDYAPYIGWYLAIGYLEDYEKGKAKSILNEMAAMYPEGTAVGDKVLEIIDSL